MDIAAWLKSLGLEQYEHAFRENAIDADVLPKLTAEDLKDLGITAVGHRRKLLEAIGPHALDFVSPKNGSSPIEGWLKSRGPSPYAIALKTSSGKTGPLDETKWKSNGQG